MKRYGIKVVTAGVCLFSMAAVCAEPPAVITINRETIKEGKLGAHEKVETAWARLFRKAKFPSHYIALTSSTGGSEAWFINSYSSFAAIEEADKVFDSGALKVEMDALDARDGELRTVTRDLTAVYRKDMSFHPEAVNLGKCRYWVIETFRVKLGHEGEFMAGSKFFLAAYEKLHSPVSTAVYQVTAGAPSGMFLFLMPLESLKSLDAMGQMERGLPEAMGRETYERLMKGSDSVFSSIEVNYFKVNAAMSYVSKETEDADPEFWRPKPVAAKPAPDAKPKTQ